MRKTTLFILVMIFVSAGFSQEYIPFSKELRERSVLMNAQAMSELTPTMEQTQWTPDNSFKSADLIGTETEIIGTLYDLQTNGSVSNRFWVFNDGTMAAVATRGIEDPAGFAFPDRGSGYNYFDGSDWDAQPTERIEEVRTGWPSITGWGESGEFVCSHTSDNRISISTRSTKGEGEWTHSYLEGPDGGPGLLWPKTVSSGENNEYIHVVALTTPSGNGGAPYMGQDGAMLYYRSSDGGQTWEIRDQIIEGSGELYYVNISADDYVLASQGNTVSIVCASAWYDLFMLKSTDNGNTWEKTVIWQHPFPMFDIMTQFLEDTLFAVGNSAQVAIDQNGNCHVVYNIGRVLRDETTEPGYYSFFPYYDGIGYWNESMEAPIPTPDEVPAWANYPDYWTLNPDYLYEDGVLVGYAQDVNGDGEITFVEVASGEFPFANYRQLGVSCMPTITVTDDEVIVVAYASVTETFATSDERYNYRHIWITHSPDMGTTWGENSFVDLQANELFHIFDECIYPQFASRNDGYLDLDLLYMADEKPGLYLDEDEQTEPSSNRIIHNNYFITLGLDDKPFVAASDLKVSECYPNPTNGTTSIALSIENAMRVSVEIFNLTGQKVMEVPAANLAKGVHNISFDVSNLTAGAYFYTVKAGSQSISKKMIVE